jgi:hypothetical protein
LAVGFVTKSSAESRGSPLYGTLDGVFVDSFSDNTAAVAGNATSVVSDVGDAAAFAVCFVVLELERSPLGGVRSHFGLTDPNFTILSISALVNLVLICTRLNANVLAGGAILNDGVLDLF